MKELKPVFLSASIPYHCEGRHDVKYVRTMNRLNIREAIIGFTRFVTSKGKLVFGGHPAISPIIFKTAQAMNTLENVVIYHSEFFRGNIPPESLAFEISKSSSFIWTPIVRNNMGKPDRLESLKHMRNEMMNQPFGNAVFIGGMEGVIQEWNLFTRKHPKVKKWPIASTGSAALELFDKYKVNETHIHNHIDLLEEELAYAWLFRKLLDEEKQDKSGGPFPIHA